jgi:hypothetical protein
VGSLRNPVGSLAPAVYWRRRVLVVLAVIAVLALVLYACSGSSGKKQPVADGKNTGPAASQSSVPASGGSSSAAASGGASSATAGAPSGGASGGSTNATSAAGSPGATGSPGANGGAAGGTTTGGGPGCQLALSLSSQSTAYANGDHPQFTVAVINKGSADCDVDLSQKSLVLNVFSGGDHIWSSADCFSGGKDLRGIAPGTVQTVTFTWNRTRSAQGCPSGAGQAQLGMYYGVVSLAAGSGPSAPAAQSQPKTFELKTGS